MYAYMYSFKNNNVLKSWNKICFYQFCWELYLLIDHAVFFSLLFVCGVGGVYRLGVNISIFLQKLSMLFFLVVLFGFVLLIESTKEADCFKNIRIYLRTGIRIKDDRDGGITLTLWADTWRMINFISRAIKIIRFYIWI